MVLSLGFDSTVLMQPFYHIRFRFLPSNVCHGLFVLNASPSRCYCPPPNIHKTLLVRMCSPENRNLKRLVCRKREKKIVPCQIRGRNSSRKPRGGCCHFDTNGFGGEHFDVTLQVREISPSRTCRKWKSLRRTGSRLLLEPSVSVVNVTVESTLRPA
jgi:hypothetical protein